MIPDVLSAIKKCLRGGLEKHGYIQYVDHDIVTIFEDETFSQLKTKLLLKLFL